MPGSSATGGERVDDRKRVHVGAETLGVHPHHEALAVMAWPFNGGAAEHVRVGEHVRGSVPSPANCPGSPWCQGDHGVCRSQQHVLLLCMCVGFRDGAG